MVKHPNREDESRSASYRDLVDPDSWT